MSAFRDKSPKAARVRKVMEIQSFPIAGGKFLGASDLIGRKLLKPGMAIVPPGIPYAEEMFAARLYGKSMEPRIKDRSICMFHPHSGGSRQDRIVLVEDRSRADEPRYTLKKYGNTKRDLPGDTWEHTGVNLRPLNPKHDLILLEADGDDHIIGWFVGHVTKITRVKTHKYRDVDGTWDS